MVTAEGGRLVAKTLYELGVWEIFSLGGGHINPIYKAGAEFGLRIIDTHHEQGASMAADAYGRIRRKPGVCLVTAGPGFTNTITGIAGAYLANSPLLVISGRSGVEENDRLSLQEIDQQGMAAPITKWARTVFDAKRIPEYIASAYKKAVTGRPGPGIRGRIKSYRGLLKGRECPYTRSTSGAVSSRTTIRYVSALRARRPRTRLGKSRVRPTSYSFSA